MFNSKQKSLVQAKKKKSTMNLDLGPKTNNAFVNASGKRTRIQVKKAVSTTSLGNGALKLTTTGSDFVDDFGNITNYKVPRSFKDISKTIEKQWEQDALLALKMLFYIRMVTRTTVLPNSTHTETTQRGQGLKHEGIFRMIWVAVKHPIVFWRNIPLFISVGSWKDIITMLQYDLVYNQWEGRVLDWDKFGKLILAGLENSTSRELIKKYLPQIKSGGNIENGTVEAQADTMIGKWICSLLFGNKGEESGSTYKKYRKLKSSGTAHEWQQLISKNQALRIDFTTIHGRALAQLVTGKFLKNQGLTDRYQAWIETQPVAKYTGYPYELFKPLGMSHTANKLPAHQEMTINKQFLGLIETAKKGMTENGTFITVIDSSGSMTNETAGTGMSAYGVAKSMALFFSYLQSGPFAQHFLEFSDETIFKSWEGVTPVEKYRNETSEIVAGTNFLSVADHFGRILNARVPESDFPTGILCVSDGCFNSTGRNKGNFNQLLTKLLGYGFSDKFVKNFKVVLWDIPNRHYGSKPQTAFEDFADTPNLFHISGLDPAAIAFLTGVEGKVKTPRNSDELFQAAMDQEVLNLLNL